MRGPEPDRAEANDLATVGRGLHVFVHSGTRFRRRHARGRTRVDHRCRALFRPQSSRGRGCGRGSGPVGRCWAQHRARAPWPSPCSPPMHRARLCPPVEHDDDDGPRPPCRAGYRIGTCGSRRQQSGGAGLVSNGGRGRPRPLCSSTGGASAAPRAQTPLPPPALSAVAGTGPPAAPGGNEHLDDDDDHHHADELDDHDRPRPHRPPPRPPSRSPRRPAAPLRSGAVGERIGRHGKHRDDRELGEWWRHRQHGDHGRAAAPAGMGTVTALAHGHDAGDGHGSGSGGTGRLLVAAVVERGGVPLSVCLYGTAPPVGAGRTEPKRRLVSMRTP